MCRVVGQVAEGARVDIDHALGGRGPMFDQLRLGARADLTGDRDDALAGC